jgi:formylglycine-generating enzyme required for sulfatase activity
MKRFFKLAIFILVFNSLPSFCQELHFSPEKGLSIIGYSDQNGVKKALSEPVTWLTFQLNGRIFDLSDARITRSDSVSYFHFGDTITGEVLLKNTSGPYSVTIQNLTNDTIEVENIVPFGEVSGHIYLTSSGPWALARAKIFRPGLGPVGVILPDNAWEMGYGAIPMAGDRSLCAIARRVGSEQAEWRRYKTVIYPGGMVKYHLWTGEYTGDWQNGVRKMFREKWLFDLESFDETLYRREDLEWIRHDYIIGLQFGWNKEFYDWKEQRYQVEHFLADGEELFGGYDVFGLWPTWPRLGVDTRNQWDLFADLPGGLDKLQSLSRQWKDRGTKFFICYNPWDESTRSEDPYSGMAGLIQATDADGVVLDCHGASSFALQRAADSVKQGVVMYSEGMAIVKDMPGIVSGRVHDAIYLPPQLNLNKLIRPDFAIFRVCQVHDGRIRREASIAFFNGYGTEINTFAPSQLDDMREDLIYLGKTTRILRENTSNFLAQDWTPLLPTLKDSIWVNKWPLGDKTVYTIFSLVPQGFKGPLFEAVPVPGYHLVSLWHHEELEWTEKDGKHYIPATVEAFNSYDLGTRTEGNVDCIALLPGIIKAEWKGPYISVNATRGDILRIWAGNPSYQNSNFLETVPGTYTFSVFDAPFYNRDGKYVIQLFERDELLDELVLKLEPCTPRLLADVKKTIPVEKAPEGMVMIPAGSFPFRAENSDQFIPYPDTREPVTTEMNAFFIDKYPVTNRQYMEFLQATKYLPRDPGNFLKHWQDGKIPSGLEDHPVVYVSLEDARAYADWAGKRLPSEAEWQYAASGKEGFEWPWGNEFDSTRCNNASGSTLPVDAFRKSKSPFGVMDLTGNVWQFTSDVYDNGTYYFVIMKGGSHYKPTSSWWYVKGGPQPNYWHQQLLLVSPSFDRNSTVGFRCVKDVAD